MAYSYLWWFLSVFQGWYVEERKAVSLKKITFGQKLVEWDNREQVKGTYVTVENVYRLKKKNMRCYGGLVCSYHQEVAWRYVPCHDYKCILFIVIRIAVKIMCNLLKVAKRNTRLKVRPKNGDSRNKSWLFLSKRDSNLSVVRNAKNPDS